MFGKVFHSEVSRNRGDARALSDGEAALKDAPVYVRQLSKMHQRQLSKMHQRQPSKMHQWMTGGGMQFTNVKCSTTYNVLM